MASSYAEKRGADLDEQLERAWITIQKSGVERVDHDTLNERIVDLTLRHKLLNSTGLQLADLVVSPIGRRLIGKATHEDWRIIEGKFLRGPNGNYEGFGLTILP